MFVTAVGLNSQTGIMCIFSVTYLSNMFLFSMALMGATDKKTQKKTHPEPMSDKESVRQSELHKSLTRSATIRSRAMAEEIAHSNRSVLRHKLSVMAGQIGYFGLLVAACTFLLMMTRFCVEHYAIEGNDAEFSHLRYAVYYFIIGVTILVVAVPEGNQINRLLIVSNAFLF